MKTSLTVSKGERVLLDSVLFQAVEFLKYNKRQLSRIYPKVTAMMEEETKIMEMKTIMTMMTISYSKVVLMRYLYC